MTERLTRPADFSKIGWRTNPGSPNGLTAPDAPKRADGFPTNAIPPSVEENWRYNLNGLLFEWLDALIGREWSDVWEGILNTTTQGDQFKVYHSTTGLRPRGLSVFNVASPATGGGVVNQVATDGEFCYFFGGTGNVYINRVDPAAGGQEQEHTIPTGAATALDADGAYVYYSNNNAAVPGLRVHDRLTLAQVRVGGAEYACDEVRSNGSWCVGISPNSGANKLVFYTGLGTAVTENTVTTAAATLHGLAIDGSQVYVGDNLDTIYAYTLSGTPSNVWTTTLPLSVPVTVRSIACDGNVVYVATDRSSLTGAAPPSASPSGSASVFALDRHTGEVLWSRDLAVGEDCYNLAVDQGYLYCASSGSKLFVYWLRAPEPSRVYEGSGWGWMACDGVSIVGTSAAGLTGGSNIKRAWFHRRGTQTYMRVLGNDSQRAPFYTLALPINDGV
jgi:hypothetical protein